MRTQTAPVGNLSGAQVGSILTAAAGGVSQHGIRPWRFECTRRAIELHADATHAVPGVAYDHREVLLACGAALLNVRLAVRALDVHPIVRLLPDPARPDLLALVRPQGRSPAAPADRRLAEAISRTRVGRDPAAAMAVPAVLLAGLRQAAEQEQAWMATIAPAQLSALDELVRQARHGRRPGPALLTGISRGARDVRSTANGSVRRSGPGFSAAALIAVIGSFHDLPLARLQAGQAIQRVLLIAETAGLPVSFVPDVVEVPATRRQLRELIGGGLWPQIVLRFG